MGLFLALSGVVDAKQGDVAAALAGYAKGRSGSFDLAQGSTDDRNIGAIVQEGPNTTVLYPDGFFEWDEASRHLSASLGKTVFALHIHDGDLWMFVLFADGAEIGRFNPMPDYWEELPPEEMAMWQGDADLIAQRIPGVSAAAIARYFKAWDDEDAGKAYPDDEFEYGDCWQMCDFMKRVGLAYPLTDTGEPRGDTFRLRVKNR